MTTNAPIFPYAKFYACTQCNRCGAVYPTTLNHTCVLDRDMAALRERAEKAEAELLSARAEIEDLTLALKARRNEQPLVHEVQRELLSAREALGEIATLCEDKAVRYLHVRDREAVRRIIDPIWSAARRALSPSPKAPK